MIKEISPEQLNALLSKDSFNARTSGLATRILSISDCFYEHNLCNIYSLENKNRVCGVLVVYLTTATLLLFYPPDYKELCAFLSASSILRLECDARAGIKISHRLKAKRQDGEILYIDKISRYSGDFEIEKTGDEKRLFNILKNDNPAYKNADYNSFYCDAFYRKKLPSIYYILSHRDIDCACATVMHRHQNTVIISDVTVIEQMRRRGLASALVARVCSDLLKSGLHPVLFRTAKQAKGLYKKLKFKRESKFSVVLLG